MADTCFSMQLNNLQQDTEQWRRSHLSDSLAGGDFTTATKDLGPAHTWDCNNEYYYLPSGRMSLCRLPMLADETIQQIGLFAATSNVTGPPSGILSLLATCRSLHHRLNINDNPHLYAEIFRAQFDTSALQRRLHAGQLNAYNRADELKRRWICLRRIRMASRGGEDIWSDMGRGLYNQTLLKLDLSVAYLMFLENDGKNAIQLIRWAYLENYLNKFQKYVLIPHHLTPQMPPDSDERALYVWLTRFIMDYERTHRRSTSSPRTETLDELMPMMPLSPAGHFPEPKPPIELAHRYSQVGDSDGLFSDGFVDALRSGQDVKLSALNAVGGHVRREAKAWSFYEHSLPPSVNLLSPWLDPGDFRHYIKPHAQYLNRGRKGDVHPVSKYYHYFQFNESRIDAAEAHRDIEVRPCLSLSDVYMLSVGSERVGTSTTSGWFGGISRGRNHLIERTVAMGRSRQSDIFDVAMRRFCRELQLWWPSSLPDILPFLDLGKRYVFKTDLGRTLVDKLYMRGNHHSSIRGDPNATKVEASVTDKTRAQALDPCPPDHPGRPSFLNNLATALLTRFQQQGGLGDLDNAIMHYHQALDLCPPGHHLHSLSLNNLASSLSTRFEQKGDMGDLDKAISYHHHALDLCPPGHHLHSSSLNTLVGALSTRLDQKDDMEDLDRAISYHQQALDLRPPCHPNLARSARPRQPVAAGGHHPPSVLGNPGCPVYVRLNPPSNRNTAASPTVAGCVYRTAYNGSSSVIDSLSLPDFKMQQWHQPKSLTGIGLYAPALLHEKHTVVLSDNLQSVVRLTPSESTPLRMACMSFPILGPEYPPQMLGATMSVCSTTLFLYGSTSSRDNSKQASQFWSLDLEKLIAASSSETLVWKRHVPQPDHKVPPPRTQHSCTISGSKLYIFGGKAGDRLLHDTWEFDSHSNRWKELVSAGAPTIPRSDHSAAIIGGYMYVFGGIDDNGKELGNLAAMKISDPHWYDLRASFPSPPTRVYPVMVTFGTHIYIYGGEGSVDSTIQALDIGQILNPENRQPLHCSNLSDADINSIRILDPATPTISGGFCDVFIARHVPTNLKLAMKRPRYSTSSPGYPTSSPYDVDKMKKRLRRETQLWSSLNHPNILPLLGLAELYDATYLISPWMEGGNLAHYLTAHSNELDDKTHYGFTHPEDALHVMLDEAKAVWGVASGLSYLHSIGVIHGDVRAKNVLLAENGNVVLCDFGLSGIMRSKLSAPGFGSMRWSGPELFEDESPSLKSDVYAFGMTIVEILTGAPPFAALNNRMFVASVIYQNKRPSFDPIARHQIDFLPLWKVASLCWDADPDCRPLIADCLKRLTSWDRDSDL